MVKTNDVRNLITSEAYNDVLAKATSLLRVNINDATPPSQMFNIEADGINKSGISLSEIERICSEDDDNLVRFIGVKLSSMEDVNIDDCNENDDKDVVVEKLPFYKTFLIGYVIEYTLLKNHPNNLDGYLKLLKVPKYKQYASELRGIYSKL